ncbi:hypothetical protein NQ315_000030 [Exocentrus adspersus]|uniref:Retrotransposon Copia-like N-terminal domain-containing protein n=1 Tax=Exocentrus adspersus TaxID=1586481 RepID=A0AAV8VFH7_9CUCU|nr:hypothetical protein NQ315_000030 [Exocentrus adspersus]
MADKEYHFVKLNETNYTMWKFGVTLALGSADLMGFIDETEDEPDREIKKEDWKKMEIWQLQRVIYIFFYLFGKQNGACNVLHGEVILKGFNRKQTEFIAVQEYLL